MLNTPNGSTGVVIPKGSLSMGDCQAITQIHVLGEPKIHVSHVIFTPVREKDYAFFDSLESFLLDEEFPRQSCGSEQAMLACRWCLPSQP